MAAAFDRLRALADQRGQPLEAIAQDLVNSPTRPAP
jgi:AmiR/NasT family two-component response regulator